MHKLKNIPTLYFNDAVSYWPENGDYDNLLPNNYFYLKNINDGVLGLGRISLLSDYTIKYDSSEGKISLVTLDDNDNESIKAEDIIITKQEIKSADTTNDNSSEDDIFKAVDEATDETEDKTTNNTNKKSIIRYGNSIQNIGYYLYYQNMKYLKSLGWSTINDSEDIIYYLISLDNRKNSSDNYFTELKDTEKNSAKLKLRMGCILYDSLLYWKRYKANILNFWNKRINVYERLENILSAYDQTLSLEDQIIKYLEVAGLDTLENKKKIRSVLYTKNVNNLGVTSTVQNVIDRRLYAQDAIYYVWSTLMDILFNGELYLINEGILTDIYNYGLYKTLYIPETADDGTYKPYYLNTSGKVYITEDTPKEEGYDYDGDELIDEEDGKVDDINWIYDYIYDTSSKIIGIQGKCNQHSKNNTWVLYRNYLGAPNWVGKRKPKAIPFNGLSWENSGDELSFDDLISFINTHKNDFTNWNGISDSLLNYNPITNIVYSDRGNLYYNDNLVCINNKKELVTTKKTDIRHRLEIKLNENYEPEQYGVRRFIGKIRYSRQYFGDCTNLWLNEDRTNIYKCYTRNLFAGVELQIMLNKLFISELSKSFEILDAIQNYQNLNTRLNKLNEFWEGIRGNDLSPFSKLIEYPLQDFNVNSFWYDRDCIYSNESSTYQHMNCNFLYYNFHKHEIESYNYTFDNEFKLQPVSSVTTVHNIIDSYTSIVDVNTITPIKTTIYPKGAYINNQDGTKIKNKKIGSYWFCCVEPDEDIEINPFYIYPYNANNNETISWCLDIEDLQGLPNFSDYDTISNYSEIDPSGLSNTNYIHNQVYSEKISDAPAVELCYNFYPTEFCGNEPETYTYYTIKYSYTIAYNFNVYDKNGELDELSYSGEETVEDYTISIKDLSYVNTAIFSEARLTSYFENKKVIYSSEGSSYVAIPSLIFKNVPGVNYSAEKNDSVDGKYAYKSIVTAKYTIDPTIIKHSYVGTISNENQYKAFGQFYLGSVSQWQIIQDNVVKINKVIKECHEDNLSNNKSLKLPDPQYFYEGNFGDDELSHRLFWTSTERDANYAWMMFFDQYNNQLSNKLLSAYLRPFFTGNITTTQNLTEEI
jgi:hypothetical protein